MFGSGKLKEMEAQLTAFKGKLESAVKEKLELTEQLKKASEKAKELEQQLAASRAEAEEKIAELRRQLEESEGEALKEQARQTIVEYEGLKELYVQKNQEIDSVRESTEEGFAREAATKRHELEEEIATNRADNEVLVSQTVQTFAGSYQYYLDQVRGLMDALSRAAQETGASLFDGNMGNIKERFGAKILEHLQENTDTLRQDSGDLFLIGKEEECEKETPEEEACEKETPEEEACEKETSEEEACEKETPEEEACGQEANEAACRAEAEVEEAPGAGEEDGEDEDDDSWEEDGDYEEDEP